MRNAFASEIENLAGSDNRIVLLSGDIGNRLFNSYKEKFPDRFYNCGVAEANMTSMAAGMAMGGLRPVTYTIAPFNTSRCYEQIKLDICYQKKPVVITGVGGGLSYAGLGATHHSFEDIAIMRVLPDMTVLCPADAVEVRLCLEKALDRDGPVYIRLGKKNEPIIHETKPEFTIGKGIVVREGKDICLLGCGNIMPVVVAAADRLAEKGMTAKVVSMHTVKPMDEAFLADLFAGYRLIATVEEHSVVGGFGSAVAEWMADHKVLNTTLLRFGIRDAFTKQSGDQENARKMNGLTPDNIVTKILKN